MNINQARSIYRDESKPALNVFEKMNLYVIKYSFSKELEKAIKAKDRLYRKNFCYPSESLVKILEWVKKDFEAKGYRVKLMTRKDNYRSGKRYYAYADIEISGWADIA